MIRRPPRSTLCSVAIYVSSSVPPDLRLLPCTGKSPKNRHELRTELALGQPWPRIVEIDRVLQIQPILGRRTENCGHSRCGLRSDCCAAIHDGTHVFASDTDRLGELGYRDFARLQIQLDQDLTWQARPHCSIACLCHVAPPWRGALPRLLNGQPPISADRNGEAPPRLSSGPVIWHGDLPVPLPQQA